MFSNFFLKSFRILLLPFAFLYGGIVWLRNWLYHKNILKSATFNLPIICVGNLSVGGTGKSPMVEYIVKQVHQKHKVAILSRGYKRKTKGYALADAHSTAIDIGDEPMQFYHKFPQVPVAVGEERLEAIPQLLHDRPDTEMIILDDAFQHRAINAGLNILLTDCNNLFTRDFFLPTGDLRDMRSSYKRAHIIVVTKCAPDMSEEEKEAVIREIEPVKGQQVFFTTIAYGELYHITQKHPFYLEEETAVLLITGIANPKPLKTLLEEKVHTYYMMHYGDHHIFTLDDWKDIQKRFNSMEGEAGKKIIVTTEKDAMRLLKYDAELHKLPFYVIPIEHRFLFGEGERFNTAIFDFISQFKQKMIVSYGTEK